MADTNCTPLECPALPRVTLDQAVIDLLESIALQESALSHILCAESQKMKTAMAMEEVDLCKLLEINDSATNMVHAVANLELVLKEKLEFISNNLYYPSAENCSGTSTAQYRRLPLPVRIVCRAGFFIYGDFMNNLDKRGKNDLSELMKTENCAILSHVYV